MTDLNLTDLLHAAGYAAIVYLLFNVFISFGSGKPLVEWINPHRHYLLWLSGALMLSSGALLQRAEMKYDQTFAQLLEKLVREERAAPETIGAMSFCVFAVTTALLFLWCRQFLPRDPETFSRTAGRPRDEYRRAMRHYIRWSRQLDYVVMFEVSPAGTIKLAEEALPDQVLFHRLQKVDPMRVAGDTASPKEEVAQQKARWDDRADAIVQQWGEFDRMILPCRQGENVHVFFDVEYGGVFVERLKGFKTDDGTEVRVFVFAACVDEHGISTATASEYFRKLCDAIKHIRGGNTAHYK